MKTQNNEMVNLQLNASGYFKRLSKEEEKELAILKDNGDMDARKRLIECNQRLVISEAKKYNTNVDFSELLQEGYYGLIHAVDKYDSNSDTRLSTYAIPWIRKYQYEIIKKENKANTSLSYSYDDEGNRIETRDMMLSLDNRVSDDGEALLVDMVKDDSYPSDSIYQQEMEVDCKKGLLESNLTDLEYEILCQKLGIYEYDKKVSTKELATKYSMKPSEIDKIYAKAKAKLKESSILQTAYEDYSYGRRY